MVRVFSLPECGKCESAKQKLAMFEVDYEECDYKYNVTYHEGWEEDGSVQVLAARSYYGDKAVPLFEYNGKFYDYPGMMKTLKQEKKGK